MEMRKLISRRSGKILCIVLALSLAWGPATQVWAQPPATDNAAESEAQPLDDLRVEVVEPTQPVNGDTTLVAAADAGKISLTYVTPQAAALATLRPHQLLTSPNTALFPVEVVSAAGLQQLGVDPADVREIVAFVEPPLGVSVPYGLIIKFAKPFSLAELREPFRAHTQQADFAGKEYLRSPDIWKPSFYMPDDQTLLVMSEPTLQRVLAPQGAPLASPLLERVSQRTGGEDLYAVIDVESLRPLIVPWLNVAAMRDKDFPEEYRPFLDAPNLISAVDLSLNITNSLPTVLAIHAQDAKSAERLMEMDRLADEIQRKHALEAGQMLAQSNDPIQQAFGKYLERVSKMDIASNRFERHGENLVLFQMAAQDHSPKAQMLVLAVGGILVALLLPAIQAAREAARRAQSMNNMKQLMLSMLNYADSHKVLPPHAIYSADGKPLLSWRVQMLPYLEENELYQQFHLDEPWDSPHNRTLIEKMPAVFDNPNIDEPGKTNYLALVGPECVMDGTADGIGFAKISDGTSKTIVLVEADADRAIEWTRPDDIKFDAKDPHAGFGKLRPGGSNTAFCDGHIQFINSDIDPGLMKALITRNGREVVDAQ